MDIKLFIKAVAVLVALSLLGYALNYVGAQGQAIDSFGKLLAFDVGLALAFALCWPYVRGVRKGDGLMTDSPMAQIGMPGLSIVLGSMGVCNAFALSNGRKGEKIRVRLIDGRKGEARITDYAGTFSPARVQVTEIEKPAPSSFVEIGGIE